LCLAKKILPKNTAAYDLASKVSKYFLADQKEKKISSLNKR